MGNSSGASRTHHRVIMQTCFNLPSIHSTSYLSAFPFLPSFFFPFLFTSPVALCLFTVVILPRWLVFPHLTVSCQQQQLLRQQQRQQRTAQDMSIYDTEFSRRIRSSIPVPPSPVSQSPRYDLRSTNPAVASSSRLGPASVEALEGKMDVFGSIGMTPTKSSSPRIKGKGVAREYGDR